MSTSMSRFGIIAVALLTVAAGCKTKDGDAETPKDDAMLVGPENIVVVGAHEVRNGPAISGTLTPEEQANIRAEVGGAVVQTLVEQGETVRPGQPLARIDDTAIRDQYLSARSGVATAQVNMSNARRQMQRMESLSQAGAVSDRDVEGTRAMLAAAEAQLASARAMAASAEKQLAKTTVRSPIAGIVSARSVSAGDVIAPGAAIAVVVKPSTMRLEASVPAEQLSAVHVGAPVDFAVNGYPDRHFTGRVTRINPIADPATRQVRIIVSVPNTGGTLVGGLFADGRVSTDIRTAPTIPLTAVDETGLRPAVMRIKAGKVQRTEVELGLRDAETESVEVRRGLVPGDTVLVGAARGISPGTPVRVSTPADVRR